VAKGTNRLNLVAWRRNLAKGINRLNLVVWRRNLAKGINRLNRAVQHHFFTTFSATFFRITSHFFLTFFAPAAQEAGFFATFFRFGLGAFGQEFVQCLQSASFSMGDIYAIIRMALFLPTVRWIFPHKG